MFASLYRVVDKIKATCYSCVTNELIAVDVYWKLISRSCLIAFARLILPCCSFLCENAGAIVLQRDECLRVLTSRAKRIETLTGRHLSSNTAAMICVQICNVPLRLLTVGICNVPLRLLTVRICSVPLKLLAVGICNVPLRLLTVRICCVLRASKTAHSRDM